MMPKLLTVVLLATLVVAEIPSYIKICGRKDPNVSDCVKTSIEGLREKLRTGIPEMEVPSIEPVALKSIPLSNTDQLKAYATNGKLYGVSGFDVKTLKVDLEGKKIEFEFTFKELTLDAEYDVEAKILIPIKGRGPISVIGNDCSAKALLTFDLFKRKDGVHLFFTSINMKIDIGDYRADFKAADGTDSEVLATAVNAAIAGGRKEILDAIRPNLEKVLSEEALQVGNKICKHFTYNELFPDRE